MTVPALVLLGVLLILAGCDGGQGRMPEAAEKDPFKALELIQAKVPTAAKAFTVPSLRGQALSLADFKEHVVLLNFWATWCPPCREEMPSMERLYQRYRGRPFTIVAISIDKNVAAVAPFVGTYRLTFPVGLDPQSEVADKYGIRALPTSYLIDRTGSVVAVALGPRDWDSVAAHAVVESLAQDRHGGASW